MFLGSKGLPKVPEEAHETSQDAPKDLQNLKQKGSRKKKGIWTNFGLIWGPFWASFWTQNGPRKQAEKRTWNVTLF